MSLHLYPNNATAYRGAAVCDQVTMPAPLAMRLYAEASPEPAPTWIEAWLPQAAFPQLEAGMAAQIALTGPMQLSYQRINGAVTDVVSGESPRSVGSTRFCRVGIRPQSLFFVDGKTYHPLLPGVSIQVMLHTADGSMISLLAAVRAGAPCSRMQ